MKKEPLLVIIFTSVAIFFGALSSCGTSKTAGASRMVSDTAKVKALAAQAQQLINNAQFDAALLTLDTAETLWKSIPSKDSLMYAEILAMKGTGHYRLNNLDQAQKLYEQALSIRIENLPPEHLKIGISYFQLGNLFLGKVDLSQSREYYLKALGIFKHTDPLDSVRVGQIYFSLGNVASYQDSIQTAKDHFQKALIFFQKPTEENLTNIAIIRYAMGNIFKWEGNFREADSSFQIAYSILKNQKQPLYLAAVLHGLGNLAQDRGDLDTALSHFREGLSIYERIFGENSPHKIAFYIDMGNTLFMKGDLRGADSIYHRALDITLASFGGNTLDAAKLYGSLGTLYTDQGDRERALEYYMKALEIFSEILGREREDIATTYRNIGIVYKNARKDSLALAYLLEADAIYRNIFGEKHLQIAGNLANIGNTYSNLGMYDVALDTLHKALDMYRHFLGDKHQDVAKTYVNIAIDYRSKGNFDIAIENLESARKIFFETLGPSHPKTAYCLGNLFETYGMKKDFPSGEPLIQQALDLLAYDGPNEPSMQKATSVPYAIQTLQAKGDFYLDWHAQAPAAARLRAAHNAYAEAMYAMDWYRNWLQTPGARMDQSDRYFGVFEGGISTSLHLKQQTDSLQYWHKAFEYSEKSKSLLLYEAMQNAHALAYSGIPPELLYREEQLRIDMALLEKKRQESLTGGAIQNDPDMLKLSGQLFNLREEYEALIGKFENEYHRYFQAKYDLSLVSVPDLQQMLNPGQTLIEYFTGDSSVFIFIVKKDGFEVREIKKDFPLKTWVEQMRRGIELSGKQSVKDVDLLHGNLQYADAAYNLYQKLVAPVRSRFTKNIIVIPDGELSYLPFEALLMEKPADISQFGTHRYLVRDYTISYAQSATLLREMLDQERDDNGVAGKGLVMAPWAVSQGSGSDSWRVEGSNSLYYSGEEADSVGRILGAEVLYDSLATLERFKELAPLFPFLHLTLHGIANQNTGNYSFLAFYPGTDGKRDNKLFVRDMYNLKLNAEMVVLSACETALGEYRRGEGIIGMARAFTYAGTRSLFATLWQVNDKPTKELVVRYYRLLQSGLPKDKALQEAKLYLIAAGSKEFSHPYFWAGMIGIGDMRPIQK